MSAYGRLRQGSDAPDIIDGIETIDASELDKPVFDLGHSYYVRPLVMRDMRSLLQSGKPAPPRE